MKTDTSLKRHLGLASATAVVVGEIIGVGIFLTPAGMAKSLGSPFWLLIVWMVMGAMAACGALCYGELASRFPEAGGGYVYLREAYGPGVAFLYGWKCFLVMDPGITAAFAVGLASYASILITLPYLGSKALAICVILVLAGINILGVKFGAGLMRWLTALKLGSLATIILWAIIFRLGDASNFIPFFDQRSGSEPLMGALPGAMIVAFFSFAGWWNLSKLAAEVRDPYRILSRALFFGVLIVTLVYVVTSAVFIYLMPIQGVTSGETFAAQAGEKLFGKAGAAIFSSIVMVSIFGSLAAVMMSAPRVYFAMSRDRLFFKQVAELHPRFSTPARAIVLQAVLSCLLVALGTFNQIIAYFVFVTVLFVALTVAAVFILRRRDDDRNLFRTVGYPLTPALFIVLVVILLFLLAATNPMQAFLGAIVVALGLPVYYFFLRRARLTMRRGGKGALST